MESINKIIYSITKETTETDIESQPPLLLLQTGCGAIKLMVDSGQRSVQNKTPRHQEPSTSTEDGNKVLCETCNIYVNRRYFVNHTKSNLHKNNVSKSHCSFANVSVVDSAFGQRIISFKIESKKESDTTFPKHQNYFCNLSKVILFFLSMKSSNNIVL